MKNIVLLISVCFIQACAGVVHDIGSESLDINYSKEKIKINTLNIFNEYSVDSDPHHSLIGFGDIVHVLRNLNPTIDSIVEKDITQYLDSITTKSDLSNFNMYVTINNAGMYSFLSKVNRIPFIGFFLTDEQNRFIDVDITFEIKREGSTILSYQIKERIARSYDKYELTVKDSDLKDLTQDFRKAFLNRLNLELLPKLEQINVKNKK